MDTRSYFFTLMRGEVCSDQVTPCNRILTSKPVPSLYSSYVITCVDGVCARADEADLMIIQPQLIRGTILIELQIHCARPRSSPSPSRRYNAPIPS
jgi:hypothetical protein